MSYLQGNLGRLVEADSASIPERLKWRLDPRRGGRSHVLSDIGSHAHQLATFVTGDKVSSVMADIGAVVQGRTAHDTASVIVKMRGGARGMILASKAASGADNRISIEVYGDKAGLRWEQASPNQLHVTRIGKPAEIRSTGLPTLHPLAPRAARVPVGHPEAFLEAFGNLYRDFAHLLASRIADRDQDPLTTHIPMIDDGIDGLRFIEACLESSANSAWIDCFPSFQRP